MARRKVVNIPVLKSWEDVDNALREMALEEIAISDIENEMNRQLEGAKAIATQESKPHNDRIEKLTRDVEIFVAEHREELGKLKTRTLNFGECGFRETVKIIVPAAKEKKAEIIRKLRALKMEDCIKTKEDVIKTNLRQYGADRVHEVGATWKQKDEFWCEAAREKLESSM